MLEEFFKTLLGGFILLPGCYLVGAAFGRFFTEEDYRLRGIFYMALGFIGLIFYLMAIGSVGQLNRTALLFFFPVVFILQRAQFQNFGQWLGAMIRYPWGGESGFGRFFAVIFYGTVILTFFFCLLPETANDALCYQLNVPKQFVWQGSIKPITYDANSYMPMSMNLLYAAGLLFNSIGIAKMFHAGMALLLTYVIAFKVEHLTGNPWVARFSALMFWLAPVVVNEITTTYVDVGVSFFLLISFLWLYAAVRYEKKSLILLAGVAAGVTVAIKFSLLLALPVLVLAGFGRWLRPFQFKKLWSFVPILLAGIFLGCGYWFTRNFILTGNPTFPYFGEVFHTIGLKNTASYLGIGVAKTLWNFLLLPVYLSAHPTPFDHHYWVGPYLLLTAPALVLSFRNVQARPYLFFTLLLTAVWFVTTQATRYLLPVLPFWYIAVGAGLPFLIARRRDSNRNGKIISLSMLVLTACLLSAGAYHYRVQFLPLTGIWSLDEYLRKMERSYPAAQWVDQHLTEDARIFNVKEVRQFYFKRPMVREEFLHLFTQYTNGRDADQTLSFLKDQGFTHIMLVKGPDNGEPPERLRWLAKVLSGPDRVELMGEVDSEATRDGKYRYSFYRIR